MFDDVLDKKKEKKKKKVLISKLQPVCCTEKVWPTDNTADARSLCSS